MTTTTSEDRDLSCSDDTTSKARGPSSKDATVAMTSDPSFSDATVRAYHVLKIDGYSRTFSKNCGAPSFKSNSFRAGGHTWSISYHPKGSRFGNPYFISLYLSLDDMVGESVTAKITFSLLDQHQKPVPSYRRATVVTFFSPGSRGFERFIKRQTLEQSEHLKDDCFAVRVDIHVVKEAPSSMVVPPSDMHQHLRDLLLSKEHSTDVEFQVGGEAIPAHRLLLEAQWPIFKTDQHFCPNKEGITTNVIRIDNMEADVFRALLSFVYTDEWPLMLAEEESVMYQRLLIAADRYGLERLKFMCEGRLCGRIDTSSVATILLLADKHHCPYLKKACFDFLDSSVTLHAVMGTEEFEYLCQTCSSATAKQLKKLSLNVCSRMKKAKKFSWKGKSQVSVTQPCSAVAETGPRQVPESMKHDKSDSKSRTEAPTIATTASKPSDPSFTMATSSSSTGQPSRSATQIVCASQHLVLKIKGYSKTLNTGCDRPVFDSSPFRTGDHTWHVSYRPKGSPGCHENHDYISFFLYLDDDVQVPVTAMVNFSLLDQEDEAVPYKSSTTMTHDFSLRRGFGYEKFIERKELERCEHLKDDCFKIRVQIYIVKETPSVAVPPSTIQRRIGNFLLTGEGANVEFRVGEERFAAHRLVLGARSPVFKAQLYGPMKEGDGRNIVQIDDMEAQVFRALLTFMYTDAWPEMEQEDEAAMAQHLLVAADRYCLQRLKLMCEQKLSNYIGNSSVAIILGLAEKHHCCGLKEACFKFLRSSTTLLAPIDIEEFKYLAQSCPTIMNELESNRRKKDPITWLSKLIESLGFSETRPN